MSYQYHAVMGMDVKKGDYLVFENGKITSGRLVYGYPANGDGANLRAIADFKEGDKVSWECEGFPRTIWVYLTAPE